MEKDYLEIPPIEEYYDFNLLDLLDNEDANIVADSSNDELLNNERCMLALEKLRSRKLQDYE